MKPKWAPEGLPGGVWAAWAPFGPLLGRSWVVMGASWRAPGASWSRLGGSWGAPGASRGAPGAHLGLPGGSFWSVLDFCGRLPCEMAETTKSSTVQHFVRFLEVPGAPDSLQNRLEIVPWRVWAPRKTSGGLVGLSWASLALSWGRLRGSWAVPGWLQAGRNLPGLAELKSRRAQKLSSRQVMN